MLSSPTATYALGGALVLVAAFSFTFVSGPTAVFVGVAAAVAAAVLIIRGVQLSGEADTGAGDLPADDIDWDGQFRREFGEGR